MNSRLPTIFDDLFPDSSPEFAEIADAWPEYVVIQMLTLVWDGFDRVKALPNFRQLDFERGDYAQLERSLTDLHMQEITILYREDGSKFESFVPHHEAWEFQNLTKRKAQPPSSDLGFVHRINRRIRWTVEAKLLKSSSAVAEYVRDLQKYLDGTSSPFSTQAALGGYLIAGTARDTLTSIGKSLNVEMSQHRSFPLRPHEVSRHMRRTESLPTGMPASFLCHHLIFSLS